MIFNTFASVFLFIFVIAKRMLFFWLFQEMEPSISRLVLIINSFPYWPRSMRTSLERSVELCRCKIILLTFNLQLCAICLQLWQGRWQGDEIIVKVLQVRDWTTRKSRDFNEEHPKLRYISHKNLISVHSWECTFFSDLLTDSCPENIKFQMSLLFIGTNAARERLAPQGTCSEML